LFSGYSHPLRVRLVHPDAEARGINILAVVHRWGSRTGVVHLLDVMSNSTRASISAVNLFGLMLVNPVYGSDWDSGGW
jgi:hypothetical protein